MQDGTPAALFKLEPTHLLAGPYAIRASTGEILRVLRLYEDDRYAFVGGSVAFNAQLPCFQWLRLGVSNARSTIATSLTFVRIE